MMQEPTLSADEFISQVRQLPEAQLKSLAEMAEALYASQDNCTFSLGRKYKALRALCETDLDSLAAPNNPNRLKIARNIDRTIQRLQVHILVQTPQNEADRLIMQKASNLQLLVMMA